MRLEKEDPPQLYSLQRILFSHVVFMDAHPLSSLRTQGIRTRCLPDDARDYEPRWLPEREPPVRELVRLVCLSLLRERS